MQALISWLIILSFLGFSSFVMDVPPHLAAGVSPAERSPAWRFGWEWLRGESHPELSAAPKAV